jgi:hypothetical protein
MPLPFQQDLMVMLVVMMVEYFLLVVELHMDIQLKKWSHK